MDRVVVIQWTFAAGLCSAGLARVMGALDAGDEDGVASELVMQRQRLTAALLAAQERQRTFDELSAPLHG